MTDLATIASRSAPGLVRGVTVPAAAAVPPDGLLSLLARALDAGGVACCQWKGHWSTHRWASGEGDVDLLVDHRAITGFRSIAGELGFKPALLPGERQLPGVESYLGHDPAVARLLHIHVHYRLVVGDFWRTTYRLPIERQVLETSAAGALFRAPSPEYQLVILVLRLVLQQGWRLPPSRWFKGIQSQLDDLEVRCSEDALARILEQHLPAVGRRFFGQCVRWLRRDCNLLEEVTLPLQLQHRLRAHSRRPRPGALMSAAAEKILPAEMSRSMFDGRMRPCGGGTVIALVGGDGSGKTTCARELEYWLCRDYATIRAELGNPPRSALTFAIGGALKVERAVNHQLGRRPRTATVLELLRYLCAARDSYRLCQEVQRFAARGGIAVCERYPVSELPSHVGPCIPALLPPMPGVFRRLLRSLEGWYYRQIRRPDALFVLRLEPELAVLRKPDEPADYVRTRGRAVSEADWTAGAAEMVDASGPLHAVLQDLKARIWRAL